MAESTETSVSGQYTQVGDVPYRLYLRQDQIPTQWYNLRADMPEPPEPMRLPNGKVAEAADIAPVFCDALVAQELDDTTAYFDIPEGVQEMYKVYRPSPLCRAYNLERALGTPARIYYKFEGNNTSGSHKLNSAVRPGLLRQGTGPGRRSPPRPGRGSGAPRFPRRADHFGLDLRRVHGEVLLRAEALPHARSWTTFDASVTPSPSDPPPRSAERCWQSIPALDRVSGLPPSPRRWSAPCTCQSNRGRYLLGSVLNQVLLHQSIIGLESRLGHGAAGRVPRHRHRLRRRRVEPGRADRAVHGATSCKGIRPDTPHSWRWSPPAARA